MGEPTAKGLNPDDCVFEFVCSRCGETEHLPLISPAESPRCHCGFPLWPIAEGRNAPAVDDMCGEHFLDEIFGEPGRHDGAAPLVRAGENEDAEASTEEFEHGPLDHPHLEPYCAFCAVRQLHPRQHRLWCRVFLYRECSCGFDRR